MFYSFRAVVDGQRVSFSENNPVAGKYEAIVILMAPLNTDAVSPASQSTLNISRSEYQTENTKPFGGGTQPIRSASVPVTPSAEEPRPWSSAAGSGFQRSTFGERSDSPVTPGLTASNKDTLSYLYADREKRSLRRTAFAGEDVFVDVNKDAYQRFMQGEQITLSFEEGGNYLSSPFILVENRSQLYLNFHQFNDGKLVPQDKEKLLSQIFEIRGTLPNYVKVCKPAIMIPKGNVYVIASKGVLIF